MGQRLYIRSALCTLSVLSLSCVPAFTQSSSPSANDRQLLSRLGEAADELQHKLPNFSCDESVLSEEIQQGKVHHHATFTTTIRAQRNSNGFLEEELGEQKYEVNIFSAMVHHIPSMPLFVSGGFSQALDYFSAADQLCFDYRFSGTRIDFASLPTAPLTCHSSGTQGFALLDADGNVTHVERTVEHEASVARHQAQFASIDLSPVELNGHTYRLSHHVVAEMPGDNGVNRRFTADFSNCKLFTATITLSPSTTVNPSEH